MTLPSPSTEPILDDAVVDRPDSADPTGPTEATQPTETIEPTLSTESTLSTELAATPAPTEPVTDDGAPLGLPSRSTSGGWTVIGGSTTGPSHVRKGRGCDDALGAATWPAMVVAVVADGAGSASHSGVASRLAVQSVLADLECLAAFDLTPPPDAGLMPLLMERARARVLDLADRLAVAARDVATTLAILVVANGRVLVAQIGDGAVVLQDSTGAIGSVASCRRHEYVNEATFLTSADWREELAVAEFEERAVVGAALMTDGLEYIALESRRDVVPHAPFFRALFDQARDGADSPSIERFLAGATGELAEDDKTLVVLVTAWETASVST